MQQTPQREYLIGAIFIFLASILFSSKAIIVKLAYQYEVDSISLLSLRMLFALPFFVFIAIWKLKAPENRALIKGNDWWKIIALGCAGSYVASLFDFLGLQYITASMERVILFTYPTIVLLMSAIILKKKINRKQCLALMLTYSGIGIAFWSSISDDSQTNLWLGAAFVFGAAFFYAVYVVGSGELLPRIGSRLYNSIAMTAAALAVLIHNFSLNGFHLGSFETPVYWYALLMGLMATVIPSFMMAEGIKRIGANNTSIINSIGPISTVILAYIFLGERLDIWQWLGTVLVIIGVLTIVLNKQKRIPKSEITKT